ncbi:MAG: helix-turn-helix domain-containing protein [Candidatus Omnitrophica bacterium]|nr:helix-turn-helix domain-containing protein [Candidatus Omnitrophota bacterium]
MEKIGGKIRRLIKEGGYATIKDFYSRLAGTFEKTAIDRSTLTRLLKNQVVVRERTLNQIAIILGVKTSALREGTTAEVSAISEPEGIFTYNDKAALKILDRNLPFATTQLILKAGGQTSPEQDRKDAKKSLKWIFVLVGKIDVVIKSPRGEEVKTLHKSQRASFDARQVHYIKNVSQSTSVCLIVHYPADNNVFYSSTHSPSP